MIQLGLDHVGLSHVAHDRQLRRTDRILRTLSDGRKLNRLIIFANRVSTNTTRLFTQSTCSLISLQLAHNHKLNKSLVIKAKISSHRYTISLDGCQKIIQLMDSGPIPTKTLKHFLEKQYPTSVRITAKMIYNVRVKVKQLKSRYGSDIQSISSDMIKRVFNPQ